MQKIKLSDLLDGGRVVWRFVNKTSEFTIPDPLVTLVQFSSVCETIALHQRAPLLVATLEVFKRNEILKIDCISYVETLLLRADTWFAITKWDTNAQVIKSNHLTRLFASKNQIRLRANPVPQQLMYPKRNYTVDQTIEKNARHLGPH